MNLHVVYSYSEIYLGETDSRKDERERKREKKILNIYN